MVVLQMANIGGGLGLSFVCLFIYLSISLSVCLHLSRVSH